MGSLFKLRDFWSVAFNEEFSAGGVIAANVDNEANGSLKIILGSLAGVLRIFSPKQKGYRADDVMLEKKFPDPILQVSSGNFLPNSANRNALALLFPKKLVIASVVRVGGANGGGGDAAATSSSAAFYFQLQIHVEHFLEHTAYNFTTGSFGHAAATMLSSSSPSSATDGQEFICVQSMDGQVTFADHNKIILQRFLPSTHFLVPGPLAYCAKTDSILTVSSSMELHSYRYQVFTQSTGSETKDVDASGVNGGSSTSSPGSLQQGRKISPDWSLQLGEDAVDVRVCRLTRGLPVHQVDIVVICERSILVVTESGEMRYNKRLDDAAICATVYLMPDGKQHNLVVGTLTDHLNVYNDSSMAWSAKAPWTPISIASASFCGVSGMLLALSDSGVVSLNYLGTDPASNPVQALESKELDYDSMDEEHRRLQAAIRQALGAKKGQVDTPKDFLRIQIDRVDPVTPQRTCRVHVNLVNTSSSPMQRVTLVTSVVDPLTVDRPSVTLEHVGPRQTPISLVFYPNVDKDSLVPSSLAAEMVVVYSTPSGESLTFKTSLLLPFVLVAAPVAPLKNFAYKTQIDTNKAPPPPLTELFRDLVAYGEVGSNVLSIQYCNGCSDGTVLVSKNAGRYRVQSSSLEGLWMLTSELVRRLKTFYAAAERSGEPLRIDVPEGVPVDSFLPMIDVHAQMRADLAAAQQRLAQVAQQFRAIQKRLLVRYRDRNPSPLTSLQFLFEDTYRRLHLSADEVDVAMTRLRQAGSMLSCTVQLVLLLLQYFCQDTLPPADFEYLCCFLTPHVSFNPAGGLGWEEITDAHMTHLLRTALSKNSRESATVPQPLKPSVDPTKVKKHLTIVFDRLMKGATLGAASGENASPAS